VTAINSLVSGFLDSLQSRFQDKALPTLMSVWASRYPLDFFTLFNTRYENTILRFLGGEDDASNLIKMSYLHKRVIVAQTEMKAIDQKIEVKSFFFETFFSKIEQSRNFTVFYLNPFDLSDYHLSPQILHRNPISLAQHRRFRSKNYQYLPTKMLMILHFKVRVV
jgi:hypothetical protein